MNLIVRLTAAFLVLLFALHTGYDAVPHGCDHNETEAGTSHEHHEDEGGGASCCCHSHAPALSSNPTLCVFLNISSTPDNYIPLLSSPYTPTLDRPPQLSF